MQKIIRFKKLLPKGSVLVFSLLILSVLLVTSLTILSSAVSDRKASLSTGSSARSFQVADSGVEEVLYQIYKVNPASLNALAGNLGTTCSAGTIAFDAAGGRSTVSFYQDETTPFTDCVDPDWRTMVVKIKSEGSAGSTSRAVEVAVAAATSSIFSGFPDAIVCADATGDKSVYYVEMKTAGVVFYRDLADPTLNINAATGVISSGVKADCPTGKSLSDLEDDGQVFYLNN